MATYVLEVDETTQQGQEFKAYLTKSANGQTVRVLKMEEYERAEEAAIAKEIKRSESSALLNYKDSKAEFARLRNRLTR